MARLPGGQPPLWSACPLKKKKTASKLQAACSSHSIAVGSRFDMPSVHFSHPFLLFPPLVATSSLRHVMDMLVIAAAMQPRCYHRVEIFVASASCDSCYQDCATLPSA